LTGFTDLCSAVTTPNAAPCTFAPTFVGLTFALLPAPDTGPGHVVQRPGNPDADAEFPQPGQYRKPGLDALRNRHNANEAAAAFTGCNPIMKPT
jgi:hypothetical protein